MTKAQSRKQRTLIEVIAEARDSAGISQRGLSSKLDRASDFIWKIENGYREVLAIDLIEIGHALELTAAELMARVERRLN